MSYFLDLLLCRVLLNDCITLVDSVYIVAQRINKYRIRTCVFLITDATREEYHSAHPYCGQRSIYMVDINVNLVRMSRLFCARCEQERVRRLATIL